MPSADITPKGQLFVMHETQWRPWNPGSYWFGTNFFAYGVGKNTELALTTYNAGTPATRNQAIGFGFKTAVPLSAGKSEQKLTVGTMGLANYRGLGLGNFTYGHYSLRLPKVKTRLTAGGFAGTEQLFLRNTANFLAGIEHPINKKIILLSEWMAGRHDLGFFIPGVLFHPTPRQFVVVAYKIPNHRQNGAAGVVLEYGLYFGKPE